MTNVMQIDRQRKAADILVESGGKISKGKAMEMAGYSPKTAKTPQKLTESKGFKAIMEEYGLTESLVITSLVDDIKGKRKNRVPELKLASDILGIAQAKKIDITTGGEKINEYKTLTADELRKLIEDK